MDYLLHSKVQTLRAKRSEGDYWDFKRQWPKNDDLLHDIICLANNTAFTDALLIIGVDNNDYSYHDVSGDPLKKNTQQLVDFLKDKPFAGGYVPEVEVRSLVLTREEGSPTIDVVEIRSTLCVPYFLTKDYRVPKHELLFTKGTIYTRVRDTNTPKDSTASLRDAERLWAHRFQIDDTPLARFGRYLASKEGWQVSLEHSEGEKEFYKQFPEFTIEHVSDQRRDGREYYHCLLCDSEPHWYEIFLRYHQTVIEGFLGLALDGGRYFTPAPERSFLRTNTHTSMSLESFSYSYAYYVKGTLLYKLHRHFISGDTDDERIAHDAFIKGVVIYESETERLAVEADLLSDPDGLDALIEDTEVYDLVHFETTDIQKKMFTESMKTVRVIQDALEELRGYPYPDKLLIPSDAPC